MAQIPILDLFILSCLARGMQTSYDLYRLVGVSLGASTPAFRRLVRAGLVRRQDTMAKTNRPRHEYSLTAKGRAKLSSGWRQCLASDPPPADLDSLLRVVDLAAHHSAGSKLLPYLDRAVKGRRRETAALSPRADRLCLSYAALRREFARKRIESEIEALTELMSAVKQRISRKARR